MLERGFFWPRLIFYMEQSRQREPNVLTLRFSRTAHFRDIGRGGALRHAFSFNQSEKMKIIFFFLMEIELTAIT